MIRLNRWIWMCLVTGIVLTVASACNTGTPVLPAGPTTAAVMPTETAPAPSETPNPPTETPLPPTATATLTVAPTNTPTFTASATVTATATETSTMTPVPQAPASEDWILVYYIHLNTGGPVACGDSLVAVNTGVQRSGDVAKDVSVALDRLFGFKQQYNGALYQSFYLSNINVSSVVFDPSSGVVSVRLSGTYVRTGDSCDNSRSRAQVWQTIRQFKGVKVVDILLNGNLLGDILANDK